MRICRVCKKTESSEVPFHAKKRICRDDYNAYMATWHEKNKDHIKAYRSTPEFKKKRHIAVKKAQQKSPAAFLLGLTHHITKYSNYKKKHRKNVILDVQIDYQFLIDLYNKQKGRCALSNIKMTHVFNDLKSISVDRIDSSKGYLPDNVQLVCKWANLAKQDSSNAEMIAVLAEINPPSAGQDPFEPISKDV